MDEDITRRREQIDDQPVAAVAMVVHLIQQKPVFLLFGFFRCSHISNLLKAGVPAILTHLTISIPYFRAAVKLCLLVRAEKRTARIPRAVLRLNYSDMNEPVRGATRPDPACG